MSTVQDFTDLIVWQKAHSFVLGVYKISKQFPKDELFALTSQLRRASVSVTSNIAEGFGRHGKKEKEQFYVIASGSLIEARSQLILARDLGYVTGKEHSETDDAAKEVGRLLNGLIRAHRDNYEKRT